MKTFRRFVWLFLLAPLPGLFAEGMTDPHWVQGELDNGLRYFIRINPEPERRAELRLVVNAGSILEEDDQQGLAHYLEHSAFNGTENFPRNELVRFLESLGMAFGPDLNAYTSFDETVYMLTVPTEDQEVLERAFLILSDWAGRISNTDDSLELERGVIIEEWRGGRGARARIRDQEFPLLFKTSRYAERLPIGKLEVLENFDFDRLRDFFHDWYRPDLISVVAAGDLDVEQVEAWIEEFFSEFTTPEDAPERESFEHPPHDETLVGTFSDPELNQSRVTLFWKQPPEVTRTRAQYIAGLKGDLAVDMLNARLEEIAEQRDPPFLGAGAYEGTYTRGGNVYLLSATVRDNPGAHSRAALQLLKEAERARRHGFTEAELQRAGARRLRRLQRAYAERESTPSARFASQGVAHALRNTFVPGIEAELDLNREHLPELELSDIQEVFNAWHTPHNRVLLATGPSHNGENNLPEEADLRAVYDEVEAMELEPYEDRLIEGDLLETPPEPGSIVNREYHEDLGFGTWELSNGITVMVKPTDFKQDEILLQAWREGGAAEVPDEEWPQIRMAADIADAMGLGAFSTIDLRNFLAGTTVDISSYLDMEREGVNGSASPEDLKLLMQLIHLRFTQPRMDEEAFEAWRSRLRESVRNRLANPTAAFSDMIERTLTLFNPRSAPPELEDVDALDPEAALRLFHRNFSNAYGFRFLITGAVDPEELEPLVEQWIASLPSEPRPLEKTAFDPGFPEYELSRLMRRGLEPVAQVRMMWTQEAFEWDFASRHEIHALVSALRIRLREELREERGGTYHVSVWPRLQHRPKPRAQLFIAFGSSPDQVEPLTELVHDVIAEFKQDELEEHYAQTVRQTMRRRRETDMRQNSFWNYILSFYDWHDEDPSVVLEFEQYVERVTPGMLRETARNFFDTPHRAVFTLLPHPDLEADPPEEER